jgi:hypothetical protein
MQELAETDPAIPKKISASSGPGITISRETAHPYIIPPRLLIAALRWANTPNHLSRRKAGWKVEN